ncbi:MAG: tetratricopeptide repeat protein [Hyphomonadaceae bacterium]
MTPEEAVREADRLLRAGDGQGADRALAAVWPDPNSAPAPVLILWSLVRRRQQRLGDAERMLLRAIKLAPKDPRAHAALGELMASVGNMTAAYESFRAALDIEPSLIHVRRSLARAALALGRAAEAEQAARAVVAAEPSADGYETLSSALRAQDRLEEAVAAADEAVRRDPAHKPARHARAVALSRIGRNEEALAELDGLIAQGVHAPAVWLARGVTLLNLTRAADAEAAFADGVKRWPSDQNLQNALANVRWMRGAGLGFTRDLEAEIARNPDSVLLRIACADLMRRAEARDRAEALLREGLARAPDHPGLLVSLGVMLDETDRTQEALPYLQRAVALVPQAPPYRVNLANALLRLGRGDEALREIAPARMAEPLNQEWICYETMALRQLGDPRYHELCDYELMVAPFDLDPPPGYRDIAAFNEALSASLARLHVLEAHPLDQSLRGGSQTTRSLLTVRDEVIEAYVKALDAPIRAYMDRMRDPNHPWSGRKTGNYRLTGCWSVRLKANGFHINHLHPAGWISSAYYVSLPKVVSDAEGQQGWIKFGEPRWPTPGCTAEKVVQPREGRLVLFPSYMWHGTIPFSEGERLTAPFDAVPA